MVVSMRTLFKIICTLALSSFVASTFAQEVLIPDAGLNSAIREALQKPEGPLSEQDLLSLTNLDAHSRNVGSVVGLEAAQNLASLDIQSNVLATLSVSSDLKKLTVLDASF